MAIAGASPELRLVVYVPPIGAVPKNEGQDKPLEGSAFAGYNYIPFPSAAQLTELPFYLTFKAPNNILTLAPKVLFIYYVAIPILMTLTPVTIVADIVIGVSEAIFMKYKGASNQEIKSLLYAKVVVSPLQQGIIFLIHYNFLASLPLLRIFAYPTSQAAVFRQSSSWNHKIINPFIDGGLPSYFYPGLKLYEELEQKDAARQQAARQRQAQNEADSDAASQIKLPDLIDLVLEVQGMVKDDQPIEVLQASDHPYFVYRNMFKHIVYDERYKNAGFKTQGDVKFVKAILGIGVNEHVSQTLFGKTSEDAQRNYRALGMILHPDKNESRKEEAGKLFRCVKDALDFLKCNHQI